MKLLLFFIFFYYGFSFMIFPNWESISCIIQVPIKVFRGELVDEIHQEFASWIYQVN